MDRIFFKRAQSHTRADMDNWITRIAAALCAAGSTGLFWMFGVFIAVPWREGRMLALTKTELQVVGIPLVIGFAVAWGALHIFAISDRAANPKVYATIRWVVILIAIAAVIGGKAWTDARIA